MRAYAVRVLNFLSGPRGGLSLKFWTALTNDTGPRYWHTPLHRRSRRHRRVHYNSPRCRAVKYIKDGWIFATGKYANAHTAASIHSRHTYASVQRPFWIFFAVDPSRKTIPHTRHYINVYNIGNEYNDIFYSLQYLTAWIYGCSNVPIRVLSSHRFWFCSYLFFSIFIQADYTERHFLKKKPSYRNNNSIILLRTVHSYLNDNYVAIITDDRYQQTFLFLHLINCFKI